MLQLQARRGPRIALTLLLCATLLVGLSAVSPAVAAVQETNTSTQVTEDAYLEKAPEPGDEYFEAEASDGRWVSYINPRDEYRDPYLGDGSGKICAVLLNEAGEPIVGESVPNTTVTIPTSDSIAWHSKADPMTVTYPLTENYERPLDSDQFGTADDVAQGDGYMDSHCIEFHGPAIGEEIGYGEATVDGDHADRIKVVGYIQQDGDTWNSDIDPVDAATSYEEAGGGWTYRESASHGQVVVVLQLDANKTNPTGSHTDSDSREGESNETASVDGSNETAEPATNEQAPGFGVVGAIIAIFSLIVGSFVRHNR